MAFGTIELAIAMVKAQSGLLATDTTRDDYINYLLEISKGTVGGVDEYRPFLVAAYTMWSSKGEQTLTRADGDASFRFEKDRMNLKPAIEANLRTQQNSDTAQGTIVPNGWDVQSALDALCGCEGAGSAVGSGEFSNVFSATVV